MKTLLSIVAHNIQIAAQLLVRAYLRRADLHRGVVIPAQTRRLIFYRSRQRYLKLRR
jgi:hypothetical protein